MSERSLHTVFQAGPLATDQVVAFTVTRSLGVPALAEIDVRVPEAVDPDELLGQPARLTFGRGEPEHTFDGIVESVETVATPENDDARGSLQRLTVTSVLGLFDREVDSRIFQKKDVKEIVTEVLTGLGVGASRQRWSLVGSYPKREHCVQYGESSLAFVQRLLEEEGIFFRSESDDQGEVLVFEDDSTAAPPIDGDATLPFRPGAGLLATGNAIAELGERHRVTTGKVVLRDYDFERPDLDLTAEAASGPDTDLQAYDYPGLYSEVKEGKRLAGVRLQALAARRRTFDLRSACPRLLPGRSVEIVETPHGLDGEYVLIGTTHQHEGGDYRVRAEAVPKDVPFRAPQVTPRPVIRGPQTARVVAPKGSPAEEIHTDEHGRVKVLFPWDRYASADDQASCFMRVSQLQTSGSMILPRVDWEVIVEFEGGNPDRPIVTGRLYNGRFMPPYALPEGKSRTSLQTASSPRGGGRNEIRLEDKAGSEEISIQSQKNTTLATGNNKTKSTGVHETKHVGVDAELTVGADQTLKVTNGYTSTVKGGQTASIGGNRTMEVNAVYGLTSKGSSSTSVGGNHVEMDGNPIQALIALAVKSAKEAVEKEVEKALEKLDEAVQSKVDQVMGPIEDVQNKAEAVGKAMDAVSKGDLSGAAGALEAAGALPSADEFAARLGGEPAGGDGDDSGVAARAGAGDTGGVAKKNRGGAATDSGGTDSAGTDSGGGTAKKNRGGAATGSGNDGQKSGGGASSALGLDTLLGGAIDKGAGALGDILGVDAGGGGATSAANKAGPKGDVGASSGADSATGPGHSVTTCSATHAENIGSIQATIAAAGIHTVVNGARTLKVGAAHVELVGGSRVETCLAGKTEKAVGLVVIAGGNEAETVGADRSTTVGGAILEKVGGASVVQAKGKALLAGAFHKVDASSAIVFKCGGSEVVIDGGGVTIKAAAVTITAGQVKLTKAVSEA